nr:hypothetical protein [Tanacetum cinerariifolium]
MNTDIFNTPSSDAITTSSQIEEPENSLIIEDEDINTILEKESDEENEYSFENIFHIQVSPSEYSSDNESFLEEDVSEKFFSDLPFEFHKESISSDENPIYDEEDIRLIKKILYDNSSPRPPKELNSIESFSPSPILVKDSDSFMEEIDTFLALDNLIPPGIDSNGYDSEEDNFFLDDPPSIVLETLLSFSFKNEDKVFNPGILVSNEKKSPHLLSHWGFTAFMIIYNFHNESTMMIYGGDIPIWDVPYLHFYPP